MKYESTGSLDQACYTGSGDPQVVKNPCRNTISYLDQWREDLELECKFPFYYNGVEYDECILFNEEDFLINNFSSSSLLDPTNEH